MDQRTIVIASHHFVLEKKPFGMDGTWVTPDAWSFAKVFSSPGVGLNAPEPLLVRQNGSLYRLWVIFFPLDEKRPRAAFEQELLRVNEWLVQVSGLRTLMFLHAAQDGEDSWRAGPWSRGAFPELGDLPDAVIATQRELYDAWDSPSLIAWLEGASCDELPLLLTNIWERFYESGWAAELLLTLAPLHLAIQAWWGISAFRNTSEATLYEIVRFGRSSEEGLLNQIDAKRRTLREVVDIPETLSSIFPQMSRLRSGSMADAAISLSVADMLKIRNLIDNVVPGAPLLTLRVGGINRDILAYEYESSLNTINGLLLNSVLSVEDLLKCFDESLVTVAGNERIADLISSKVQRAK
jgi:hypothetical protein